MLASSPGNYPHAAGQTLGLPPVNAYPSGPNDRVSALDGLHSRLAVQVSRVWDLRDKARAIADDVFGPAGNQTGGSGAKSDALGRYSQLAGGLDALDFAISSLTAELERLTLHLT